MLRTLLDKMPRDRDLPERTFTILARQAVLDGTLYDSLSNDFHAERTEFLQQYIPLRERRPNARYPLCRIVVQDSVAMVFGDNHFPSIDCDDETTEQNLMLIIRESNLQMTMIDAATRGSVGSVCILMRILKGRVFWAVMPTQFLTPEWKPDAPDTLNKVTERYKVLGADLRAKGYTIPDDDLQVWHWWQRDWTEVAETWYIPIKVGEPNAQVVPDPTKTTNHNLGFVPMVWIQNLPGGNDIDGLPTFGTEAIEVQIEIEYQLSQAGRGLKYSQDPTLAIREPAIDADGTMIKGGGNALILSEAGDAKLLEITGSASNAVLDYVRAMRELALEGMHGNRSNADKLSAAQSGRAMELMNQSLIWLASKLRITYGQGGLLKLLRMLVAGSQKFPLQVNGRKVPLKAGADISLRWPHWYSPTYADKQVEATTLQVLRDADLMSQETAVKTLAQSYDITDPEAEVKAIEAEPREPTQPAKAQQAPLSNADD